MSKSLCVNLLERFGSEYRIGWDPCYDPKHRPREKLDSWYMTIPCRLGSIHPFGGSTLVLEIEGHVVTRNKISQLPFTETHQTGDDINSYQFDVKHFDQIAEIVRPHRKPHISEERRQELRERAGEMRSYLPINSSKSEADSYSEVPA